MAKEKYQEYPENEKKRLLELDKQLKDLQKEKAKIKADFIKSKHQELIQQLKNGTKIKVNNKYNEDEEGIVIRVDNSSVVVSSTTIKNLQGNIPKTNIVKVKLDDITIVK